MATDPGFDAAALERLRSLGGEPLLSKMIGLFLENTPKRIASATRGEKAGDWHEVERAAHSLKSSAANLGLNRLQDLAHQVEALAERHQSEKVAPLLREIEELFPAVRARLEAERKPADA